MPDEQEQELMSAVQAAAYLDLTRQRVYELAEAGRIGRRVGTLWIFTRTELDAYKLQRAARPKGGRPKSGPLLRRGRAIRAV